MSHYDVPEVADVKGAEHDSEGDLLLDISPSEGEDLPGCRFRQPHGLRSWVNSQHAIDAIFCRSGDEAEVITVSDADVTSKLPDLNSDETQLYSVGSKPRAVSVRDDGILLGLNAKNAVACETDEVDVGTLIVVSGPSGVASIQYIAPSKAIPAIPMGGVTIALKGIIKSTNRKTKSE